MNHYPHHIGDYAKDTMGLSQGEHGAYRLLMDAAYATENGIPQEDVYAIAKASTALERRNTDRVIRKYFRLREGHYFQSRIEEEVAAYRAKAALNRENGRLGGRPRSNPEETDLVSGGLVPGPPGQTLANSHKPITKEKQKTKTAIPDGFAISSAVARWAQQHGYSNLDAHLAYFRDWAVSSGARKADWDATFRNAIRGNWARVKPRPDGGADPFEGIVR